MRKLHRILKHLALGVALLAVSPLILIVRLEGLLKEREGLFHFVSTCLSLLPGTIGSFLRRSFYFGTLKKCSWEVSIGFGSFFSHREVVVGRNVCIGAYSIIGCADIGDNVLIGSRVSITSGKYQHLDQASGITREVRLETVTIGEGSWIGEGAIVMSNIGRDCIVSAGSVVTKKAPGEVVIVGNPGRFLKRSEFEKERENEELAVKTGYYEEDTKTESSNSK